MDPALLKQQAAFKQRAARAAEMTSKSYTPSTSTSSHTTYDAEASRKKKKKPKDPQLAAKSLSDFNYKTAQSSASAANFGTMAKIVDYMKKRHLTAQQWPLSLSEILEELQVYDINKKSEAWLQQSLPLNPRLSVDENGKFLFKPPYKVKGKNSLLALLKKHYQDGKGGILLSDLNECIPAADKHIEALGNVVIDVPTQANKRKDRAYFYNDPDTDYFIDDEFKGLWRNASVDHLDEKKIEEYLQKHGIDTMRDLAPKRKIVGPPKRKAMKRRANQKVHNEHLSNVLEDYD
uniref:Transcription initiation factor IIE subunit beta n=1 Tax=Parascaris univalens TaxID=6257 RepID=A0A914ZLJ5_PARUN